MVRIMMKDSLLLDLTFTTFREMESAASTLPGLYEPHDGRELKSDVGAWNDDYMNDLMVQVISNFSRERVQHLQDVIRYLRPLPEPTRRTEHTSDTSSRSAEHKPQSTVSYEEQKRRDQQNGTYLGAKIATGAVVGAAAGAAIAGLASVTTAGIAGAATIGAFAGGIAVYAYNSKER
jgi:hypothetical protein